MKLIRFAVPIAILVLLGGGTSFAAAGSLPGDALYPVKVNVNEKVVAAFQISAEAKADFDARLAEKRLAEANKLAAEGRLSADASVRIQESFEAFAGRVEVRIEKLRESGDEDAAEAVSARFEAALQAHARALAAIEARANAGANATSTSGSDSDDSGAVLNLSLPVKAVLRAVQKNSMDAKSRASSSLSGRAEVAADIRIDSAIDAIEDARDLLERRAAKVGAEISAKADAELDAADALAAEAKAKAAAAAYVDAIKLANRAVQAAHQVSVLLNLQANIGATDERRVKSRGGARLDLFGNSGRDSDDDDNGMGRADDNVSDGNGNKDDDDEDRDDDSMVPGVQINL